MKSDLTENAHHCDDGWTIVFMLFISSIWIKDFREHKGTPLKRRICIMLPNTTQK